MGPRAPRLLVSQQELILAKHSSKVQTCRAQPLMQLSNPRGLGVCCGLHTCSNLVSGLPGAGVAACATIISWDMLQFAPVTPVPQGVLVPSRPDAGVHARHQDHGRRAAAGSGHRHQAGGAAQHGVLPPAGECSERAQALCTIGTPCWVNGNDEGIGERAKCFAQNLVHTYMSAHRARAAFTTRARPWQAKVEAGCRHGVDKPTNFGVATTVATGEHCGTKSVHRPRARCIPFAFCSPFTVPVTLASCSEGLAHFDGFDAPSATHVHTPSMLGAACIGTLP